MQDQVSENAPMATLTMLKVANALVLFMACGATFSMDDFELTLEK